MNPHAEVAEVLSPIDVGMRVVSSDRRGPARRREADATPAVIRGGVYLTVRYALSILVSLGNVFVLTWWIGPRAYGTFVTAVGLTAFLASLTRFGVDTYLVRCEPSPDAKQYNVAFTLLLTSSTGLVLLGAILVPLLERWYSDGEFVAPYLVLLLSIPLTGIAGLPTARLERELKFGTVAGIELGGQFSGFVVALLLAWRGFGVWAPVAGLVTWQGFVLAAAWRAARFSPRLRFDAARVRTMLAFGLGFSASLRTWQLRTLVNPLLVGRFAGPEGVAYVALALRVVEALAFVRIAAGRLAIAALARLQHDAEGFRVALERVLAIQLVTIGPLLCVFAVAAPWAVPRWMGERWLPSLEVYPLVAASVLVNSVFNLQASALFVLGRQWSVMWAYVSHVGVLTLATLTLLPRIGIAGYGWAELIACGAYLIIGYRLSRLVAISYSKLVPWVAVFLASLFLAAGNTRRTLWLPLVGASLVIGYKRLPLRSRANPDRAVSSDPVRAKVRHFLTLITKTLVRGWPYLRAIAEYKMKSALYSMWTAATGVSRAIKRSPARAGDGERPASTALHNTFHFTANEIFGIVASIPERLKQEAVAEADQVMRHCFDFRGQERAFGESIDWNARGSSTSWAWDLNRHSWFLRLATAFYYTGHTDYLRELAVLWEDWIRRNPPAKGFNWQYPFEVAARLRNWTWAYVLLASTEFSPPEFLGRLQSALQDHADYLSSHLEHHWPNNHLLLEAKSLYEFTLLFPEFDRAGVRLQQAQTVLEREVMAQVLADGVHSELCSMYHRLVAGELGELVWLCERLGRPLPSPFAHRIRQMHAFSRALRREDGSSPLLGDSAADDTCLRFDFARPQDSDLNYWIGRDGRGTHCALTPLPGGIAIHTFPEAGYAFLTSHTVDGEVHLTFDFGPFSCCSSPNHGHCDALSFELYAHGHPVIVDPGIYLPWNGNLPWARHFRSTSAHNTLTIDGKEQSELCDYSDVRRTARVKLLGQESNASQAAIRAECSPYWAATEIKHQREIILRQQQVTVRDRVIGPGEHLLKWSFQFAPDVDIFCDRRQRVSGHLSGERTDCFSLSAIGERAPGLDLCRGQTAPLRGWVSRNSAEVVPSYAALYTIKTRLPFEVTFVIDLACQSNVES